MERMEGARSVKSAERVFDLLETIGAEPDGVTFGGLGTRLKLPKSSLHALLDVLVSRGYAQLDAGTRRYSLGIRAWETGQAYQRHQSLLREAVPVLEAIVAEVNETAQLATLAGTENVYLAKVDSRHPLRLQSEVGMRLPAHATGVGKVLLAQLSEAEVVERLGSDGLPVFTPTTHASVAALLEDLAVIRERGFAVDNQEYTPGVFCLAVPVFEGPGRASTALSVSVPLMRARIEALEAILRQIAQGSITIGRRCGLKHPQASLLALGEPQAARGSIAGLIASGRYGLGVSP